MRKVNIFIKFAGCGTGVFIFSFILSGCVEIRIIKREGKDIVEKTCKEFNTRDVKCAERQHFEKFTLDFQDCKNVRKTYKCADFGTGG